MTKRVFSVQLCLLVLIGVFFFGPDVCLAGREELLHDAGRRNITGYWETYAAPFATRGLAVQFEPSGFPCFVREVSVFVNSTAEFRLHIVDFDQVELCDIATVAAVEPASWAVYELPSEVRVDSDGFWVVAEIVNAPEPGIGTTFETEGGITKYTKNWYSNTGISYAGVGGNGGNAMIRAVVDAPVQIEDISHIDAGNDHLFMTFDSPMDASTLNAETIRITQESGAVSGTYEYDDSLRRVEFIPDSLLAHGTFDWELSTAIADVYGNHLGLPMSGWGFVEEDVDETPPARPGNVSFEARDVIRVTWEAVPFGDAAGYYLYSGPWQRGAIDEVWLANASKTDVGNVLEASILLAQEEMHYRVAVSAYDLARNEGEAAYDDAVPHRGSVLLVAESHGALTPDQTRYEELEDCLQSGAFDYNVWLEWERGGLPDEQYLKGFDVVFWTMGGRRFASEDAGVFDLLQPFLSSGGSLYYESRLLLSRDLRDDPFFPDWLHLTYDEESWTDFDAPVVVGASGDPVGDGLELIYVTSGGKSKMYFEPQDGAVGFLNVQDKEDEVCGLRYADTGDYGYRLVFSTSILSLVYNTDQSDKLMSRALCWLEGKDIDLRIASNTRVLEPYSVLELFVSANTLAGVEADVDAYLAVLFELEGASGLIFYDGAGFVSEMTAFVSGVHLESGLFLPRTKVFEYLYRGGLPSGKYTFFVALTQAGTQTFLTDPRGTIVFMK